MRPIRGVECGTEEAWRASIHNLGSGEVIKRLAREGWTPARQRGGHRQYTHPERRGRVTVPHPSKEIPTGTLRNIYRQAGWSWKGRS